MSKGWYDEHEWEDPQRDRRGRYVKGISGNPDGRPPKKPEMPKSLAKCLLDGLAKQVAVNDNGTPQLLPYRELLVEAMFRKAVGAKSKEILQILERVDSIAAGAAEEEHEAEEIFTEEDRRILEAMNRIILPTICVRCAGPAIDAERKLSGDDSSFD